MRNRNIIHLIKDEKSFRYFLTTRFFLTLAIQIQAVAAGWEIYQLTHDVLSLGLIGLAEAIPAIGIALFAGYIADRSNRKHILVGAVVLMLVSSLALLLCTFDSSIRHLGNQQTVYVLYICIFFNGLARGFYSPTAFAFLSQLIAKEKLAVASTLNSTSWQIAAVVGPAIAGILFETVGITMTMSIVLGLMSIALFSLVSIPYKYVAIHVQHDPFLQSLKEGIRFVWNKKVILSAISLDMFSVLFGGAVALLPVFADEILHVGANGLGFMRAAPSLGSVITMLWLSMKTPIQKAGVVLLWVVAGFGLCMLGFACSQWFALSLGCLFASGIFDSVSVVIRSNIIQLETPDHMKGRVSAVNTIFIGSSNEIGAFESGVTAKWMGTVTSVFFGACMTLGIVGFTAWKSHSLRTYLLPHHDESGK